MVPWRAVDAHSGGPEADSGATVGSKYQCLQIRITLQRSRIRIKVSSRIRIRIKEK
jgi:hypothetical protein